MEQLETARLQELLIRNKKRLDRIVLDFLPAWHDSAEITNLYEMMRDYPSRGGKGLRGSMCILWCNLLEGKDESALITSSALELFQNWILIHDDIEDQSDLRRGLPALHKKVGIELAINAGDALHGKMWELLLRNQEKLGSDLTIKILQEFASMLNATTEGQQMELAWTSTNKWDIKEEDYFLMVAKKSAWYTCISPARLGILIATLQKKQFEIVKSENLMKEAIEFGTQLGISFQIIDDVLNLMGEETKYGKEIMGDLFEGKRTVMLIHLLSHSDSAQKRKITDILSKPREKKELGEVKYILDCMHNSGSIDYAKGLSRKLSKKAISMFDDMISRYHISKGESYLVTKSLMEYLSSRDY